MTNTDLKSTEALIGMLPDAAVLLRCSDRMILSANAAAASLLSQTPHSIAGQLLADMPVPCAAALSDWLSTLLTDGFDTGSRVFDLTAIDGSHRQLRAAVRLQHVGGQKCALLTCAWLEALPQADRSRTAGPSEQACDLLQQAVAGTRDGVWDWDIAGDQFAVTGHWQGLLPAKRLHQTGIEEWREQIHPDDFARLLETLNTCLRGGRENFEAEYRIRVPGNYWLWVLDRGQVVTRDADGTALRMVGLISDISSRREVEQRLRDKESAIEASIVGIAFSDLEGWISYVNPAVMAMWHSQSPEDMIGRNAMEFLEQQPQLEEARKAVMEGRPWSGELIGRRADGSVFDAMMSVNQVRDEAGKPMSLMASCMDISRLKQAETRLRQAATVFENTSEALVITDRDTRITAVNRAFSEITGHSEQQVLGQPASILKSGRHPPEFYAQMWRTIVETGRWQGEIWNRRITGDLFPAWLNISTVRGPDDSISDYVAVFSDISVIKKSQDQLRHLAHHDPLTSLPNRLLFNDRLQHALDRVKRQGGSVAVLFLDLDRFKVVNDTFGHPVGDRLLRAVAGRLKVAVRKQDTVARLGGDEFTVMMEDLEHSRDAATVARKIIDAFRRPFPVDGHELYTSASIGISLCPGDGEQIQDIVRKADAAMYRAKALGRNTYQFHVSEMTDTARQRYQLETSLRRAVEEGQFELYYQPQVSARTGALVAVEALIRWRHPRMGLLTPAHFLSLAEETGLIRTIGDWVLREACQQWVRWREQGLITPRLAVNISAQQIAQRDLADKVHEIVGDTGMDPLQLELEITEGFIMEQVSEAVETLERLRNLGVTLSIDDFGTGYSSLAYLKKLPIHRLKIDRSFVRDIPKDRGDEAIARAIIALGHTLQMTVVAEGVETEEQLRFLRDEGCDLLQGYLLGPPQPAAELAALLESAEPIDLAENGD